MAGGGERPVRYPELLSYMFWGTVLLAPLSFRSIYVGSTLARKKVSPPPRLAADQLRCDISVAANRHCWSNPRLCKTDEKRCVSCP